MYCRAYALSTRRDEAHARDFRQISPLAGAEAPKLIQVEPVKGIIEKWDCVLELHACQRGGQPNDHGQGCQWRPRVDDERAGTRPASTFLWDGRTDAGGTEPAGE
jgi:hypothetical protein